MAREQRIARRRASKSARRVQALLLISPVSIPVGVYLWFVFRESQQGREAPSLLDLLPTTSYLALPLFFHGVWYASLRVERKSHLTRAAFWSWMVGFVPTVGSLAWILAWDWMVQGRQGANIGGGCILLVLPFCTSSAMFWVESFVSGPPTLSQTRSHPEGEG